ncbi:dicarboxylate/amino acid:cation symporter [Effusibacillus dendaii]|uniref:C4-dicarboxylate transport protein n=1 Tax=Effusibacillus dendaii TaxID=2743772 RepID=A0A7I8DC46_9BACL|nr:dicarboxylate/amino acid:cation symporter [Effusibacillus dendaii]BCJ86406.1 C4-dicarboxylate transport protein [Effusibacillus dendaii]
MKKKRLSLTVQVLIGLVLGIAVGFLWPKVGTQMQPIGDTFINMIKMVIGPIVFVTIVVGIANMGDMKKVGRVGGKAILYFEIVSTIALAIGLFVVHILKPGAGLNLASLAKGNIDTYTKAAAQTDWLQFFLHVVPNNVVDAFAKGDLLQILFFSVFFGAGLSALGEKGKPLLIVFEKISDVLFKVVGYVMKVSPIGAFAAISFTIGKFGIASLIPLGKLMICVYATMILFVVVVLGSIAKLYGFSIFKFIRYIKDELLIVLGTSSSESVLPRMMDKMEKYGCSKPVVGMVLPTGYSFNLDGTAIYLSAAVVFIAQVYNVHLSIGQMLTVIAILMLTSKGAAAVTGGGFVTLAATLAATHVVPVEGLALLLGVDRFMSEARALVNLVGNGVATVVVSKMEKEFDESKMIEQNRLLSGRSEPQVKAS